MKSVLALPRNRNSFAFNTHANIRTHAHALVHVHAHAHAQAENTLSKRSNDLATQMEASERLKTFVACEVEESSLVQCLRNDPAHTLNCHELVEAYTECAARARRTKFGQ